jgi:hypothetical protein
MPRQGEEDKSPLTYCTWFPVSLWNGMGFYYYYSVRSGLVSNDKLHEVQGKPKTQDTEAGIFSL